MSTKDSRRTPPTDEVRRRMSAQPRADTAPEVALRRELHRRGLRFRVGIKVPGNARRTIDIAFPGRRIAIFVDGCFWHRCPVHSVPAKTNAGWWSEKLAANVARDAHTNTTLEALSWRVVRVWEHEDPIEIADSIELLVREASLAPAEDQ
ncbi:very short patch repair endonuclease [Nocardioides sp. P5_E3]